MTSTFFICFGAFALFLSAIGLYGVLAFTVSQRTREIGIRMALGAKASDVASTVVQQGVRLALFGACIGLVGALASARFIESYLYAVRPYDPAPFMVSAGMLIAMAALACYIPARRATKVDPMVALRYE
jgi:ABC-type antimicrobial peptide transport system permease subunit